MYLLPTSNYLRRNVLMGKRLNQSSKTPNTISHQARVKKELKDLGVSWFGLHKLESHYLPSIIHPNEKLGGVVYGHHKDGFAMLVATDRRVIFLDKKPLTVNEDEISYFVVSGVSVNQTGFVSTVTLHTRIKDYPIRTFNLKCAQIFMKYIELRSLEHKYTKEGRYDQLT